MKYSGGFILLSFVLFFSSNTKIVAQWSQTNGPYGGAINCLSSEGNILFAGTNSGLFRSEDNGASWSICMLGRLSTSVGANPTIAITGVKIVRNNVIASTNNGFFISRDYGSTWKKIESYPLFLHNADFFQFKDNFLMYGCKNFSYIFRTDDSLKTFIQTGFFYALLDTCSRTFEIMEDKIFIGGDFGVLMSSDSGKTWIKRNNGLDGNVISLISKNNILFAGINNGHIFKSINDGISWEISNYGLKSSRINCLAQNGNILYAGTNGDGIFVSSDDGANWLPSNQGLVNQFVNTIIFNNNIPIVGTLGGGVFSHDLKWYPINNGLSATEITSLVSIDSIILAAGKNAGIFFSTDGGNNWIPSNYGLANLDVRTIAKKGNKVFAGTYGGGVYISEDKGLSWSPCNSGITQKYISKIAIEGDNIFAGTCLPPSAPAIFLESGSTWADSGKIYLSSDEGVNWTQIYSGGYTIRELAAFKGYIFASNLFLTIFSQGFFNEWSYLGKGDTISDGRHLPWEWSHYVKSIGISGNNLFAGTSGFGVYFSADTGKTWSIKNKFNGVKWSSPGYNACSFSTRNSDVFVSLIGESDGIKSSRWIYKFNYSDSTWYPIDTLSQSFYLFSEPAATSLLCHDDYLFAGTNGFGIWKLNTGNVSVGIEEQVSVPQGYKLSQNFPNPFNPLTTISYSIPKSTFVTLKVYDILGGEVSVLVNEEKAAGIYNIEFNAKALSSGVYFYRLQAGPYSDTKKLLLLR